MLYVVGSVLAAAASPSVTCDPNDQAKCMCNGIPIGPHTWKPPSWLISNKTSLYDTEALLDGALTSLSQFKAKATMLVNVASA